MYIGLYKTPNKALSCLVLSLALDPHSPGISIPGGACHTPSHPWNFRNFFARLGTLWKEYLCQKMSLHDIIMRKIIFPAIK